MHARGEVELTGVAHGTTVASVGAIAGEIVRVLGADAVMFARIRIASVDDLACVEDDLIFAAIFLQHEDNRMTSFVGRESFPS